MKLEVERLLEDPEGELAGTVKFTRLFMFSILGMALPNYVLVGFSFNMFEFNDVNTSFY